MNLIILVYLHYWTGLPRLRNITCKRHGTLICCGFCICVPTYLLYNLGTSKIAVLSGLRHALETDV